MFLISQKLDKVYGTNNSYIINNGRRFKCKEVASYQKSWEFLASANRHIFRNFDPKSNYIQLDIMWYNPKFYKKNGELSKTAGDTDGVVKFIKDGICDGIGLNDAFVKKESVIQLPSDLSHHSVSVVVSIEYLSGLV